MIRISFLIFAMLFATLSGWSQEAPAEEVPTGQIEDAQIIIEKDKPLTLPRANRVYGKTEVLPVKSGEVDMNFNLSAPTYDFDPYQFDLPRKDFIVQNAQNGYDNFLLGGFGNYISPLLQAYLSKSDEARKISLWLHHESFANGPVRDDQSAFGTTRIVLNSKFAADQVVFAPTLNYERDAFYYYGFNKLAADAYSGILPMIRDQTYVNHFTFIPAVYSGEKSDLSFYFKPTIGYTDMAEKGQEVFNKEFFVELDGGVEMELKPDLQGVLGLNYGFWNYQSGISQVRNVLTLAPAVRLDKDQLSLTVGADFTMASDSADGETGFYVYPNVVAKYHINDQLSIYGEVLGGMNAQSLHNAKETCMFLEDSLQLNNANEKIFTKVAVSYKVMNNLQITPYLNYSITSNKALIGVSGRDSARFEWIYDRGNFGQLDLGVKVGFAVQKAMVTADMKFTSYQPDMVAESWYLPASQLDIFYTHALTESLNIHASMMILDGIQAMAPLTSEVTQLNTIVDFGVGASYDINDKISTFADIKNLFNQNYERYLNYPVIGLNAKIGFKYRF